MTSHRRRVSDWRKGATSTNILLPSSHAGSQWVAPKRNFSSSSPKLVVPIHAISIFPVNLEAVGSFNGIKYDSGFIDHSSPKNDLYLVSQIKHESNIYHKVKIIYGNSIFIIFIFHISVQGISSNIIT